MTITIGTVYGVVSPVGATVAYTVTLNGAFYATGSGTTNANGLTSQLFRNAPAGTYSVTVTLASTQELTWDGATPANSFVK